MNRLSSVAMESRLPISSRIEEKAELIRILN